jgi:hypothetical protein
VSGRRVLLLLLILVMGGGVDAAWFVRQNLGVGAAGCRVMRGRFYGPSFSYTAEERRAVTAPAAVEVDNSFGDVRVTRADGAEVHVTLRKVVYRDREGLARAFADRIALQVDGAAPLRVRTNREDLERSDPDVGFETHLELQVPAGTSVVVRNEHGQVDVADVAAADVSGSYEPVRLERVAGAAEVRARHADVTVTNVAGTLALSARHGDVQVEDVQGAATLDVEHGDVNALRVAALTLQGAHGGLTFEDVRGDLEVHAQYAAVSATDVAGRATIDTSYEDIDVRRVSGDARLKADHGGVRASAMDGAVTAESSYNDVELARVAGSVDVRTVHGGLQAADLLKGGRVAALGGDVSIQRFAGALEVQAERAAVDLLPAGALKEPLLARTTFGDIRLHVPAGSRMQLEASASNGEVGFDVPGLAVTRDAGGRATGTLAGGTNAVRLATDHGNVEIASAPAASAVAEDDGRGGGGEKRAARKRD